MSSPAPAPLGPATDTATAEIGRTWSPWRVVVGFGTVSLAADMVYEGARSVYGPLLASLGASALVVGAVTGAGEAAALVFRVVSGPLADRTGRYWTLTIAVDVGLVVNPDGVVNQIEGGALQALSWTTKEQVRFDARTVTSRTWEDYPILTFSEVPPVDVVLLERTDDASLGAGEASIGPTAAAIGNALYAATGLRVRTLPLTPENVVAAMDA